MYSTSVGDNSDRREASGPRDTGDEMGRTATATKESIETLTPFGLADLLGVDRADAGLLSTNVVRVPGDVLAAIKSRLGPRELSVAEISLLTGIPQRTVLDWLKAKTLVGRRVIGRGSGYRTSPQALVECLRKKNDGPVPPVIESPKQEADRGAKLRRGLMGKLNAGRR